MAQVGSGTVAVVGQGFHHHGNAAGAVAFVGDGFVIFLLAALSALDDAHDVVVRHVQALRLGDQIAQLAVHVGVAAALTHSHADFAANLGEDLSLLAVGLFLLALNVVPFAMSRHVDDPPYKMLRRTLRIWLGASRYMQVCKTALSR